MRTPFPALTAGLLLLTGSGGSQVDLVPHQEAAPVGGLIDVSVFDPSECDDVIVTISDPRALTVRAVINNPLTDGATLGAPGLAVRPEGGFVYPSDDDHELQFQCLRPAEEVTVQVHSGSIASTNVSCLAEDVPAPAAPSSCEPPLPSGTDAILADLLEQLTGDPSGRGLTDSLSCDDQGESTLHSNGLSEGLAVGAHDTRFFGGAAVTLADGWPASLGCDAPGTHCPGLDSPAPGLDFVLFAMAQDAPLPLGLPGDLSTFALVCDANGVEADNFQPHPAYPADFWGGTDFWAVLDLFEDGSSGLEVQRVSDGSPNFASSGARALSQGNVLLFAVPRSEFGGDRAGCRVTAFRHTGDWGIDSGDWNGDVTPAVGLPLVAIDLPPAPEAPLPEGATGTVACQAGAMDAFQVVPPTTGTLEISVDTVSAETTFDPLAVLLDEAGLASGEPLANGDDEFECTWPPPQYSCPRISADVAEPGARLEVRVATWEGNCNPSGIGAYALTISLDGVPLEFEQVVDDG